MKIDRNSKDEFEIEWKNYIEYAKSQLVEIKKIVAVNLSDNSKVGINLSNDTVTLKPCLKTFIFKEIIYREMRSKDAGKECIIKVFCESLAFDQDNLMDRFSRQNTSAIMPFPDELTIINKYRDIFEERCKFSIRLFENPKWNQMKDFFFSGDFFCDKRCQTHYFSYKLKAMKKRLDTTKHSEYVEALHYLGEIYLSINSVDSLKWAISKFSKVIAICDELNENKIRTMAVGNLISAYVSCAYILSKQKQDRFALKAALSFYESALSLIETNQHPYDGEKKVVLLNNIGICNLELFDENSSNYTIDDVLSCFKQSIYEAEQSFGLRCIQSVDALIYAGAICASQNEVKQAYEFFQAAWDVRAAHLGSTHPDTISINNILDDMCMKLGIFS
ncbi:MAG: hypothetical protein JSS53_00595, partial [Proteobacteria bacterium]|nr:hypothetical protein [Pseudomonadota bacterium]